MGERRREALRVGFDGRVKLELHGSRITSRAGLLADRELDEVLGLNVIAADRLDDWRVGRNICQTMPALLRQSVYARLPHQCAGRLQPTRPGPEAPINHERQGVR